VRSRWPRRLSLLIALAAAAPATAALLDWVAASVNDVAIPESVVRRAMVLSGLPRASGETDAAFRGRVLEALIDQQLQYEEALRFGPEPPDAREIEEAMKKVSDRLREEGKEPAREFAAAGMTSDDVRASVERQLVVQRYLRERFRPGTLADEQRARVEYDERFAPERRAAGQAVPSFDEVAEQMRARARERSFDDEVEKWVKELRDKARIRIYPMPSASAAEPGPLVPLEQAPRPAPTAGPR
jgi:hypothetical protein